MLRGRWACTALLKRGRADLQQACHSSNKASRKSVTTPIVLREVRLVAMCRPPSREGCSHTSVGVCEHRHTEHRCRPRLGAAVELCCLLDSSRRVALRRKACDTVPTAVHCAVQDNVNLGPEGKLVRVKPGYAQTTWCRRVRRCSPRLPTARPSSERMRWVGQTFLLVILDQPLCAVSGGSSHEACLARG